MLVFPHRFAALALSVAFAGWAGNTRADSAADPAAAACSTSAYAAVLQTHVDEAGMVNYRALKKDSEKLDEYLDSLATTPREHYNMWSASDQIAFWINAYNAITLKAITDHYPIEPGLGRSLLWPGNSIRQIPGVWDKLKWNIMDKSLTLNQIEHEILRKQFNEPRIHAALVCAAMGCPPLRREPYSGTALEAQLEDQMKRFLSHPTKFRIDRKSNTVFLSAIFKWFGKDFVERFGTDTAFGGHSEVERAILNAIAPHLDENDRNYLRTARFHIQYLDYDWTLNERNN
jgi:hypothetical protein